MVLNKNYSKESCGIVTLAMAKEVIVLDPPSMSGGMPLLEALKNRESTHSFSATNITDYQLSNLLWAANGVNRRLNLKGSEGLRTAPSARNHQEIEIYIFLVSGIYLYDANAHQLILVRAGDFRKDCGMQSFFAEVPLALCLVANFSKMGKFDEKKRAFYSALDAGYVSQNIYLYCASENLITTACGLLDRKTLHNLLKLDDARALISHPVGRPINGA